MIKFKTVGSETVYSIDISGDDYEKMKTIYRRGDEKALEKYIDCNKNQLKISDKEAEELKKVIVLGYTPFEPNVSKNTQKEDEREI